MQKEHAPYSQTLHILVVEDNEGHATLMRKGFESSVYQEGLTIVDTLAEAKSYIEKQSPDLLFVDLGLPDGIGTSLLSEPADQQSFPVVVITAQGNEQTAVEAIKAGAMDYIVKSTEALGDIAHITDHVLREWHDRLEQRKMKAQLIHADKLASLGTLVAGVAHEINNPNSFIMLNVPNLQDIWGDIWPVLEQYCAEKGVTRVGYSTLSDLHEIVPKLLGDMLEGSERIKRIVNDLKDFSRRDDSGEITSIHINDMVKSAVSLTHSKLKSCTRHCTANYAPGIRPVKGNNQRLQQVVINLLINACDALQDTSRNIRISTATDNVKKNAIITVTDDGIGMTEETIRQIADPFFTTKRASGGTGLGLAISARIINEHKGTLSFDSTLGQGTKATIVLPMEEDEEPIV